MSTACPDDYYQVISRNKMDITEDWGEGPPQSDIILVLARAVGLVVAIVAMILAVLLMVMIRTLIAFFVARMGIMGLSFIVGILILGVSFFIKFEMRSIWIIFYRSCM